MVNEIKPTSSNFRIPNTSATLKEKRKGLEAVNFLYAGSNMMKRREDIQRGVCYRNVTQSPEWGPISTVL